MLTNDKKRPAVAAEICLYGTSAVGAGWLACIADGTTSGRLLGDGTPKQGRSMTEALWQAADEIRSSGVTRGIVRIFEPNGTHCAAVDIGHMIPNFGELKWQRAPVFTISAGELIKHAEVVA